MSSIQSISDPELIQAIIEYTINRPQFDRIVNILDQVDKYIKDTQRIRESINGYLESVNTFLKDANKVLMFNNTGDLSVKIQQKSLEPIGSLSSGECQLVVILTHLALNPAAKTANVFIVDEPPNYHCMLNGRRSLYPRYKLQILIYS